MSDYQERHERWQGIRRLRLVYARLTAPAATGLPNWRVVTWFPLIAALATIILVILEVSGTSSGAHWTALGSGSDPRLILGTPRGIRSDEWLVQQGWVVSQSVRGFPSTNDMFPGGTDVTVLNELPSWDWSTALRPHLWGYLLFGLGHGIAWYWWVPALALVVGCYLLGVTMLPRRPFTVALLSGALFFTPFLQWWYGPAVLWSVAWPLLAVAAVIWILRDPRLGIRIAWASVVGYFAVTLAMTLYVPFILPGFIVFLFVGVGAVLRDRPWGGFLQIVRRLLPLIIAGALAVAITVAWAILHWATFTAIQTTVYPGQRTDPTGGLFSRDPHLLGVLGAPWSGALKATSDATTLGGNSSEGASFILLGVFLLPALVWFAARSFRNSVRTEWLIVAYLSVLLLIVAYLLIPGWDAVAHILQLDRVPPERFRIAFIIFFPLAAFLTVEYLDRVDVKRRWILGGVCAAFTAALLGIAWATIRDLDPAVLAIARHWEAIGALLVAAVLLLFLPRCTAPAAALLLVASVLMGWGVNPLYRGVFDLGTTAAGKAVESAEEQRPGVWVGVGSYEMMALLMESDVETYSGVQTHPSPEMWKEIDPNSEFEREWNRLGHVYWELGPGEPAVANPQPDVINVSFDPCSAFAQQHVAHVVSAVDPPSMACLVPRSATQQGLIEVRVYDVVPRRS